MLDCGSCGARLPAEARFCPACGTPAGETGVALEERKLATVLFADLVGSTELAGGEDPERVRARLDRFYEAMADEIERTGGTVEKFAGDAVMAAFGAPAAQEDHAERALHAALAMQRRLSELFGTELSLRIGVNTGDVVVGQPREGSSFVTGDAVNVCARLEQRAEPGEVLAGERTVAAVGGAFEFGELRTVDAKGKPDGISCRVVLRALSLARPRGVSGFHRVFVGRDSELELLRATFRRAVAHGEPHLVTIVGEPGIGKTTLVRELWEVLAREEQAPLRRTGRCLPYGDGITYWPIGEMLREHYGILEGAAPDDISRRLQGHEILGLALGADVAADLHPLDARERLHQAVVEFAEQLAVEQPAITLVEDIHWAEDDLLELLERVVREARASLVVLATSRPELLDRHPGWGGGHRNTTTIWLEPLPAEMTSRMLEEVLATELPAELRELLVVRSEGNPFFVEELVAALVEAGVLRHDEGWTVGPVPEGFSVPDSVHAVLAARIDRLPPDEKAALQAASIVGRIFGPPSVVHLLDGVEPDFDLLEERDFIRRSAGAGATEYTIKHALTREVAYSSIPKARRGRLHAALADWLCEVEKGNEDASLLAYHYAEAVRPEDVDLVWVDEVEAYTRVRDQAVRWLGRAGRLARGRHELDDAVELFTRALELSDDAHERARFSREIGEAHALRYDGERMRVALLHALEGPLDDVERADTFAFLAFQSSIRSAMFPIRLNRHLIDEWAGNALTLADEGSEARARALLSLVNIEPSDASDEVLDEASTLAESLDNLELRSYALGARSQTAFERRQFLQAATCSEQRLELLAAIDDPDHRCEAYESAAPVVAALGRFDEARRLIGLHGDLARRLSPHHRVHTVSLELELADVLGDWATLASETGRVWDLVSENLATPCVRNPRDLLLCGVAHLFLGDEERAAELERDARRVAGEGFESYLAGPMLRMAVARADRLATEELAEIPIERTNVWGVGAVAAHLDALVALRRRELIEDEVTVLLGEPSILQPFALRALGAARHDDELLARADERFVAFGLEWHRAQTETLLSGL